MSNDPRVDTIVLLMLENRSFDHVLGHLSYGAWADGTRVDGLTAPLDQRRYENLYQEEPYYPFVMRDGTLESDLPHDRTLVAKQMAWSSVSGRYTMSGFVEAYYAANPNDRPTQPPALGFLPPGDVPVSTFLADQYAVCDRFFTPIPTSTQPNRMMSLYGSTAIDETRGIFPPTAGPLILDWLSARDVRWRVYHDGLSYFLLLNRFDLVLGDRFRDFGLLARDVVQEPDDTFPEVIVVEPTYGDAPHIGTHVPNDNHPPLAMAFGEHFVAEVYRALTSNPARWRKTVLIITYDEHGGFFDHVPPLAIPYTSPVPVAWAPFESTGPRVPALVVSPLVDPRSVCSEAMDHTSVLQFLAHCFGRNGEAYSADVEARTAAGIRTVAHALTRDEPRDDVPPAPDVPATVPVTIGRSEPARTEMQLAFDNAARELVTEHPAEAAAKYPDVVHWVVTR